MDRSRFVEHVSNSSADPIPRIESLDQTPAVCRQPRAQNDIVHHTQHLFAEGIRRVGDEDVFSVRDRQNLRPFCRGDDGVPTAMASRILSRVPPPVLRGTTQTEL